MIERFHALHLLLRWLSLSLAFVLLPIAVAHAGVPTGNLTSDAAAWRVMPSDGVRATLHNDKGIAGPCLRLDFDFTTGGGFVVIQRDLDMALPENYEFTFNVRGDGKPNNLEFKLLDPPTNNDPTTSSVWWVNRPAYEFNRDWTPIAYKRRHFTFAWGPSGGKPHTKLGKIEFAIASSSAGNGGGKGSVWFDALTFRELPVVKPYAGTPTATATASFDAEHGPAKAIDGDETTAWYSKEPGSALTIDFGQVREFGGLRLSWAESLPKGAAPGLWESHTTVSLSSDGTRWTDAATDWAGSGGTDYLYLPDSEARYVRIAARSNGVVASHLGALGEVRVVPVEQAATLNAFLEMIAREQPRGFLPRWASGEQSFWTVLGVPEDSHEALINEEGQVEVGKGGYSLEPFVRDGGRVLTWNDGTHTQSLAEGHLPIATVVREMTGLRLVIRAAAVGPSGESALAVQYTLTNTGDATREVDLLVGVRPYQVNPPAQFLNTAGGATPIVELGGIPERADGNGLRTDVGFRVNGRSSLFTTDVSGAGGEFHEFMYYPDGTDAIAGAGGASWSLHTRRNDRMNAVCTIPMSLAAGASASVGFAATFDTDRRPGWLLPYLQPERFPSLFDKAESLWRRELSRATLSLPASARAIEDTFYAQQAYILINRDGPGFQPGSRSYERSWIRDGSMTSAAMLQLGHTDAVTQFVHWYAGYQFEGGKVPCVVDSRGPDPVAEHDSHGQLIMAIANVHRYTHDAAFVREHFGHVKQAVAYIEKIRGQRMTQEYAALPGAEGSKSTQEPGKPPVPLRAMYGLVPESISHEGYSAKPMHSYWDDLFVYRGLKDAAYCARVVGEGALQEHWSALAKDFAQTLAASYTLTMKTHGIDYLPGCVELGDFDATSTTVALWPVQAQDVLPAAALSRTFEKYWEFFTNRRGNPRERWEAYTPYELRVINAFVHLGQRDRAVAALEWFMQDQYPPGWHHWAEVVWSNPRATRFIGDMPHTWCGSDFLNSLRSMLVYEDEEHSSLVLFAGVPKKWAREEGGVAFTGFRTYFGTLDASVQRVEDGFRMTLAGDLTLPAGGLVVRSVKDGPSSRVLVDGTPVAVEDGAITLHTLPREIVWQD